MKNLSKRLIPLFLVFSLLFSLFNYAKAEEVNFCDYKLVSNTFSSVSSYKYLQELTSDKFEGRQSGTKGADLTAQWISDLFKGFGLKPCGDNTYFQEFDVQYYEINSPLSFSILNSVFNISLNYKKDFTVLTGSGSGKVNSKLVFAGYGITSKSKNYDDYNNIDVNGKIVLIMRRSPSTFNLGEESTYFQTKIKNASEHGAVGVIVSEKVSEKNKMIMNTKYVGGTAGSIPALFITSEVADKILTDNKITLSELENKIDKDKKPFSFDINCECEINVNVSSEMRKASNIIGYIPARDRNNKESILITAHYDHLGIDQIDGEIYRGANDNASGTAVLLEVARSLSINNCYVPSINIVFVAFAGEEEGLIGSYYYVTNPLFPLNKIRAVLNMDMVGTGTGNLIAGTDKLLYKELADNIEKSCQCLDISGMFSKNLLNSGSDHYFFHINKIPNVFFIRNNPTNIGGYHNTLDTLETVDPANLSEIGELVILTTSIFTSPYYIAFENQYWMSKPSLHNRILLSGSKDVNLKLIINEEEIHSDGNFTKLLTLKDGDNIVSIKVFFKNELIFEKMLNIKAEIDKNLICDFNFDFKVDLIDLVSFSKHYKEEVSWPNLSQIFDINNDMIINEIDLSEFDSCFGYIRSEI